MFYERVTEYCKDKGISIMEFEKKCGIGNGTVGRWKNDNSKPTVQTLIKIVKTTGVPIERWTSDQKEVSWDELSYRKIRNFCIYDVGKRTNKFNTRKEWDEMLMITISVITSALTAKIVATYYFKKVDGYVKEMCEMTIKSNENTLVTLRRLQKNSSQEEWKNQDIYE